MVNSSIARYRRFARRLAGICYHAARSPRVALRILESQLKTYNQYYKAAPKAKYVDQTLEFDQLIVLQFAEIRQHIDAMPVRPKFHVLIDGDESDKRRQTSASVDAQIYPRWTLAADLGEAAAASTEGTENPEFLVWLSAGDRLHMSALYEFACAINSDPAVDLIYADEDQFDGAGSRSNPFYKPDWSPDYLEALNYIGAGVCVRASVARASLRDARGSYDFVLRCTENTDRIAHVRKVLVHRAQGAQAPCAPDRLALDASALNGRLARTARTGAVAPISPRTACYDVRVNFADKPLVSAIIPTAGKIIDLEGRQIDLIKNCLETISERSSYRNIEFIVVDNDDLDASRLSDLHSRGVKTISYREPVFNVAKKLNLGATLAKGELLLLLNDDIEPLTGDWIERMAEHFQKPHVGVVGAKLLYPDGSIQHAGVVLNSSYPDHVSRSKPGEYEGYFYSNVAVRNFIAVTGACMMTRRSVYQDVGGYSEAFAVSYNDVDYCFKVRTKGLSVVLSPKAELTHFESRSRRPFLDRAEAASFHRQWDIVGTDPYYNERELTVAAPTFDVCRNVRMI